MLLVLVMISSMSVPICIHLHDRQANRPSRKITTFLLGTHLTPACAEILERRGSEFGLL